jgi:hypothetical protein
MLHNLFYFPQNATYFIFLSFSFQITLTFFINHALKFKYQPGQRKVQNINIYFTLELNMTLYPLILHMEITSSSSYEHANV